jgi:hypothetical protein
MINAEGIVRTRENVRPLVMVLTDSLAFVGPRTAHPVDDPRLWPNVMAAELDADVEVLGDFGWTARDAWYAVGHNPRLWSVLNRADAVVLAVGSFDTAPEPLPSSLWKRIAMIRSGKIRGVASNAHRRTVPLLSKLFSYLPGGGPVVLRPRLTVYFLHAGLKLMSQRRPGLPVLGMTPIPAQPTMYAGVYKGRAKADRATREWAATADVPLLDMPAVVGDHMLSERCNPDRLHLGWEGHAAVGVAFAGLLAGVLPSGLTTIELSSHNGETLRTDHAKATGSVT